MVAWRRETGGSLGTSPKHDAANGMKTAKQMFCCAVIWGQLTFKAHSSVLAGLLAGSSGPPGLTGCLRRAGLQIWPHSGAFARTDWPRPPRRKSSYIWRHREKVNRRDRESGITLKAWDESLSVQEAITSPAPLWQKQFQGTKWDHQPIILILICF